MIGEHSKRLRSADVIEEMLAGELRGSEFEWFSSLEVAFEDTVTFGNRSISRGVKTHSSLVHGSCGGSRIILSSALYNH